MIALISVTCWVLAAMCNSVMDKLAHHYYTSIFTRYNPKFWNPKISWKNKYKDGVKAHGPAFYLSTGVLVAFTDAWHLFKSIQIVLLATAVVMSSYSIHFDLFSYSWLNGLVDISMLGILWNVPFSFMYNKVLTNKQ